MKKILVLATIVFLAAGFTSHRPAMSEPPESIPSPSGSIVGGYRVLPVRLTDEKVQLTVYRGDYIKFAVDDSIANPILSLPSLAIEEVLPRGIDKTPFFKMKKAGVYPFTLGEVAGELTVIDFSRPQYREVTAQEAAALIAGSNPLILDVRTPMEFKQGHLSDAVLIPVQELQGRINELAAFKDRDILVYCATGNRSTVASKILIDKDFKYLYNLRHGIVDWSKKHPTVR